jgi:hypothetical protein
MDLDERSDDLRLPLSGRGSELEVICFLAVTRLPPGPRRLSHVGRSSLHRRE